LLAQSAAWCVSPIRYPRAGASLRSTAERNFGHRSSINRGGRWADTILLSAFVHDCHCDFLNRAGFYPCHAAQVIHHHGIDDPGEPDGQQRQADNCRRHE